MRNSRDVAIPPEALAALRRALHEKAGALSAVHALRSAGYTAGVTFADDFAGEVQGGDSASLDRATYFERLGGFLEDRGWGMLHHSAPHPGVGLISSRDWAEATEDGDEDQPSCAFSSGMLSALLSRAAGAPVTVLQVGCRSRGDEACSFAFGSEAAVDELFRLLSEGRDLEAALAELA
jgi:predicted hydrocarbon binding protein